MYDISTLIMSIMMVTSILIIIVVLIVTDAKNRQTKNLVVNQKSFEELSYDLKADNISIKAELADIKKTLNSVEKMMEEVQ